MGMKRCFFRNPFLIAGLLYGMTFLIILPLTCRNLVYSRYRSLTWDSKPKRLETVLLRNRDAVFEATNYLHTIDKSADRDENGHFSENQKDIDLVIVVITVHRTDSSNVPLGYLTRTAASLHRLIKTDSFFKTKLLICNVDPGPSRHTEADELSLYIPVMKRFPNTSFEAAIRDVFEKEKQDYEYCIFHALVRGTRPRFVLVVEDDAVARDDLFLVIRDMLAWRTGSVQDSLQISSFLSIDRTPIRWSYLKFYYPDLWQGYSFEQRPLLELLALFILFGTFSLLLFSLQSTHCSEFRSCRLVLRRNSKLETFIKFSIGGLYGVLLATSIGRQHVFDLKRNFLPTSLAYQLVPEPGCCTPCVLYSAEIAVRLVEHLHTLRCSNVRPLDVVITDFMRNGAGMGEEVRGFLVEPNLFRHVGILSSLKSFAVHEEDFLL